MHACDCSLLEFRQRKTFVSNLRFHWVLVDVHRDEDLLCAVLQHPFCILLEHVGPLLDALTIVAVSDPIATATKRPLERLLGQDDAWPFVCCRECRTKNGDPGLQWFACLCIHPFCDRCAALGCRFDFDNPSAKMTIQLALKDPRPLE